MVSRDQTTPDPYLNDPEFAELVAYFRGELPARVRSIEGCVATQNTEDLRRLAHQIKGAAPGFGFTDVGQAAKRLEDRLREEDAGAATIERVRAEVDALVALCRSYFVPGQRDS